MFTKAHSPFFCAVVTQGVDAEVFCILFNFKISGVKMLSIHSVGPSMHSELTWHQRATNIIQTASKHKVSLLSSHRARLFCPTERLHPPGHTVPAAVLRATVKETRTCPEGPEGEWRYSSVLCATIPPSCNNEPRLSTSLRKLPVSFIFFCEHKDEK